MKHFYSINPFIIILVFALFLNSMFYQTTHIISDLAALISLSASLGAGDTVILADGI